MQVEEGASKLGLTGPILVETFAKTGDEIRRKDEDNTQGGKKKKKQGIKLVFSPKLVHKGISHPVLDLQSTQCVCEQVRQLNKQHERAPSIKPNVQNEPQNTLPNSNYVTCEP
jgi:hypothetical protein